MTRTRRGFTLIEMIIVVAILTMLAGIAVPLVYLEVTREREDATAREMDHLVSACLCYFHDTLRLPEQVADLAVGPGGVVGWAGPYIAYGATRPGSDPDYLVDAWDRRYEIIPGNDSHITLYSSGAEVEDLQDDIVRWIDVTPQRRELTLERLSIVNAAIDRYLRVHPDHRFLLDVAGVIATLRAAGYLNRDRELEEDGWGHAWIPDPPGLPPILRLTSRHLLRPGEARAAGPADGASTPHETGDGREGEGGDEHDGHDDPGLSGHGGAGTRAASPSDVRRGGTGVGGGARNR